MKIFRSIRWRLQIWHGAVLATVLVGFGSTAYVLEGNRLQRTIDEELRRRAAVLVDSLHPIRAPLPRLPPPPMRLEMRPEGEELFDGENRSNGGYYYAIWLKNGEPEQRSYAAPISLPRPSPGEGGARRRGDWREIIVWPHRGDCVLVGRSMAPELGELHRYAWVLIGAGLATLVAGLLVGGWLAGRALRPVREIGAAARTIAAGDLSRRIDTKDTESELGELARVLNETFARLEAAFARQAQFTADAAHELRTPVTVMLTHTQNALGTACAAEEHREAFEACQRAAQRMRRLIESLLQLARLDTGALVQSRAVIDLAAIAAEGLEALQPVAIKRGIALHAELAEARCAGESERLLQVVTNLVGNAVAHNRDGGVVRVSTRMVDGQAELVVADDGPGIAAEHLPYVFERFYRADRVRSGTSGHAGLGLAIVRAIVASHAGTIEARSEPGQGAVFTVRLPGVGS